MTKYKLSVEYSEIIKADSEKDAEQLFRDMMDNAVLKVNVIKIK